MTLHPAPLPEGRPRTWSATAEYLVPIESKRHLRRHHRMLTDDGHIEIVAVDCLDDEDGIVDYPGEDYFAVILREYLASREVTRGQVGNAPSELIDAADIVSFAVSWMAANLRPA